MTRNYSIYTEATLAIIGTSIARWDTALVALAFSGFLNCRNIKRRPAVLL
jgi:hypothetical protein